MNKLYWCVVTVRCERQEGFLPFWVYAVLMTQILVWHDSGQFQVDTMLHSFHCLVIREWAVFAIRNLCDGNVENQASISQLEQRGMADSPVCRQLGVEVCIGPGGKPVIRKLPTQEEDKWLNSNCDKAEWLGCQAKHSNSENGGICLHQSILTNSTSNFNVAFGGILYKLYVKIMYYIYWHAVPYFASGRPFFP